MFRKSWWRSLIWSSRECMSKGKTAPAPETANDQLSYFLPVLPKLERRENHKTNVSSAEPILDFILPPRVWVANGHQYTQKISRCAASRMDVINLQVGKTGCSPASASSARNGYLSYKERPLFADIR
ncbi:hypothetical protein RvY_12716-3 [Ramazzottius varieornatus]|uniref:Uncharacterized protein n=1 Tax=Ramazzottius varieornatus TaxID=947166 RepID=A0A1D1VPM0_RAMVA|nr:hypothetical protein RvY_12716-3 [Ramazzottius varieornatus]